MPQVRMKGTPNQGLFGATAGFFVGFAAVALFGPTATLFKEAMELSPLMVSLLVAMPSLSGSLLRIPFSAWVDTTGGRKPLLVLLGLSLLGMLGLFLVVHYRYPDNMTVSLYPLLLLLGVFCGCGIAIFSVGISQVAYWFPWSRQGWALGTYAGIGNLAPGIFSFLVPIALSGLGLAGCYLTWLAFLVIGTVVYALTGRNSSYFQLRSEGVSVEEARHIARQEHRQEIFPAGSMKESLGNSARIPATWFLVAIYFTSFGGFLAMTAWLPTYWEEVFTVSRKWAGSLTALYAILASLLRVAGGSIADRIGGENTAIYALILTLIGAVIISFSAHLYVSIFAVVLMAIGMGICNAAVFKLVPQEVPDAVGGAAGWVGGLGAFGGFAIPPMMGLMVVWFGSRGYGLGFMVFILLAIGSLALVMMMKRRHRAQATVSAGNMNPELS